MDALQNNMKKTDKGSILLICQKVYFKLVSDLSIVACISALKRFICRIERCENTLSYNAANVAGANNKLNELSESIFSNNGRELIASTCKSKGTQFHFIPPRSPHFGGLWEVTVKSAENLLIQSLSTTSMAYEEWEAVIVEIEAIRNSGPRR